MAMLVPEGRHEVTTEGGLDIVGQEHACAMSSAVSPTPASPPASSIDAEIPQIEAAARIGARVCEIHTGPYAHAFTLRVGMPRRQRYSASWRNPRCRPGHPSIRHALPTPACELLQRAAGRPLAGIREPYIGQRDYQPCDFVGLREAVREMKH